MSKMTPVTQIKDDASDSDESTASIHVMDLEDVKEMLKDEEHVPRND
jgi:hypothetical protein